jgi:two-component system OmpR family sensor kinase
LTIRARLTLAVVVLVVVATGALGWVVVGAARSSMVDRLDERLLEAQQRPPEGFGFGGRGQGGRFDWALGSQDDDGRRPGDLRTISETFVVDGEVYVYPAGFSDDPEPLPVLPVVPSTEADAMVDRIVTVPAEDGSHDLRVLTSQSAGSDIYRFMAISMADVDETTDNLWRVFGITVAAVAAAGAGVAWFVVRRGLRPVDSMIATAGAIAGGDLSRRVDHPADNTELGRLGTALDEMLTQLEAAFAERTASENRLKRFAADASHELRTPITAIRGYAELYLKGGLAERESLDRAMARIEGESTRMGRLVEDLLVLARLDQQRPLDRVPVDLRQLVLDAAADHSAMGDDWPLTVSADVPLPVVGDESGLRQVLGNLLANARTHTPAGTAVQLSASTSADGGWAVVVVADAGPGIPAEHLDRIFERFNRGDPSRARATGGAGLGLSIVAAMVAAHGGTVDAANAADHPGAVITVRLPLETTGS